MIKLLEQVPIWKAVVTLPKRVADLEARIRALESGAAIKPVAPGAKDCPICGATMRVTRERAHNLLGPTGVKTHEMVCDGCGQTAERDYSPGKGYR